jgi:pimeloyl-ACP methyl ester carboxylesterase
MTLATTPFDVASAASAITTPTLVVAGVHDRIVPRTDTRELASSFRFGRVAFVPDAGHLPHEEQPEAFLQVVEPFLASLPRR